MKQKVFFLNLDVRIELTGVEVSAMARAKVFYEHLGMESIYVCTRYNPWLHDNVAVVLQAGRGYPGLKVANMYDWFQGVGDTLRESEPRRFVPMSGYDVAPSNSADSIVLKDGIVKGYVSRDPKTQAILYYNHIHNEKIWRRDWYDCRGFLSKTEFVDSDHYTIAGLYEYYFRPDGTLALVRLNQFNDSKQCCHLVSQRIDRSGLVIAQYDSEEEMLTDFLFELIDSEAENVFIIDRVAEFYPAAKAAKERSKALVRLIPIIHNTHYAHPIDRPGDPFTSPVNVLLSDALENLTYSDATVVLTERQRNDIHLRFGEGRGRIEVIPHSYAPVSLNPKCMRDLFKVVMIGRYAEEKQHQMAIEAFGKVVETIPQANLHLYGNGEKRQDLQSAIEAKGLQEHVFIHDFDHNIANILQTAGLTLLTSRNEGFSLVIMESLVHGCPVVSFDCNYGPAAMVQPGVNGFLAKSQDVNDLAEKVIKVLADESMHRQLIENATKSMTEFTHKAVALKWFDLLGHERVASGICEAQDEY